MVASRLAISRWKELLPGIGSRLAGPVLPNASSSTEVPPANTAEVPTEIDVSSGLVPLASTTRSAIRPPHPLWAPSISMVCQMLNWSLCDISFGGMLRPFR